MNGPPTTLTPDELEDRAAIAFLEQFVADAAAGRRETLAHYLQRFAHCEGRVAREWLGLVGMLPARGTSAHVDPAGRIGAYRLERELGHGAQGIVYLAEDTRLHRLVALKVLASGLTAVASPATLRLRREAEAIAKLEHPGIATIYETGLDASPPWIAMRYVAGGNVQQEIARRIAAARGPRTPDAIAADVRLVERAARALACAHAAGILHRDIKPGNLLLAAADEPVLADFGLAADEHAHAPTITMPGAVFGTLGYLAPERLAGAKADARCDVYSLGAVLFELLTLQRPHAADLAAHELRRIEQAPNPSVRSLNPAVRADLDVIVATAIAKAPIDRYATAAAFADDLARFLAFEPIVARPAPWWRRLRRWSQRNRSVAGILAALLVVFLGGLATTTWLWQRAAKALEDVKRLADLKLARELVARADDLWPARPEVLPRLHAWRAAYAELHGRIPAHEARLAMLPVPGTDPASDWELEQLTLLRETHATLAAIDPKLVERIETATRLVARTIEEPAAAWRAAIERVATKPVYAGLQLVPQLGLVPLGADPASGLEEFAHASSGVVPTRDSATGALRIDDDAAIVLVLIPGGHAVLGAESEAPADGRAANIDPELPPEQGPSYVVELEPFFLSRWEMTQAQWLHHTGTNPATYRVGGSLSAVKSLRHPIELVSQEDCERVLHQLDLCLPTEAQWEFAYRAGSHTAYPFGDDAKGLVGRENLADATARDKGTNHRLRFLDWLDDGWLVHAPVGSFAPNRWGLYDMGGNVKEWCDDSWEYYRECAPRPGDGLRRGRSGEYRIVRGGCFASWLDEARCAWRGGVLKHLSGPEAGVRPARRIHAAGR